MHEETVAKLRKEFEERQRRDLERALERQKRRIRDATIAGAAIGLVAVLVTAGFTRKEILWHSFLLEACLCAVAGHLVARLHGGFFKGFLFFTLAYLMAYAIRGTTFDPTVVFSDGDIQGRAAVQGNFTSLCIVLMSGGIMGQMLADPG